MSDIDFVELDKAVNNLVNKHNPTNTDVPAPAKNNPKVDPTPQQIFQKPKGRFMDVLHPSSDMGSKENVAAQKPAFPAPAPRKIVAPTYDDMVLPAKKAPSQSSAPSSYVPPVKSDWPDPIEAAETMGEKEEPAPSQDSAPKLASSLFLPDTKVEKRPLGGFSGDNVPELTDENKNESAPLSENTAVSSSELPPELEADLVAIEEGHGDSDSESRNEHEDEKTLANTDNNEPAPILDAQEDVSEHASFRLPSEKEPTTHAEQENHKSRSELSGLLAAGSIPQQYKTAAPHDSPAAAHPMFFDADQYSKAPSPGAHAPRKTTVFQWIFIVVGLLLLGATLGAALFVFVSN